MIFDLRPKRRLLGDGVIALVVASAALAIIDAESSQATDWINEDDSYHASPPPSKLGKLKSLPEANQVRSIFDDIDAIKDVP